MQQRIELDRRRALWLERLVWNLAAGAALAVMLLVLLWSLQWLDRIAPRAQTSTALPVTAPLAGAASEDLPRSRELAEVGAPSG